MLGTHAGLAALLAMVAVDPSGGRTPIDPEEASERAPSGAVRDPNDLPRMDAPYGQPRLDGRRRWASDFSGKFHARRRLQLTAEPLFSSLRVGFLGRPAEPIRGGGAAVDLDVELWRPLWLRLLVAYGGHPVDDQYATAMDQSIVQTARGGTLHATHASVGLAYALDFGRVIPLIEAGIGGLWIAPPSGVQDGQLDRACLQGGVCDVGLTCAVDNVCRQGTLPTVNLGLGVDVRVGRRFVLGAAVRYFAFIANAPGSDPVVYLHYALRLGLRF
jgi:hypothetical protein